jgi:hypothetical protein
MTKQSFNLKWTINCQIGLFLIKVCVREKIFLQFCSQIFLKIKYPLCLPIAKGWPVKNDQTNEELSNEGVSKCLSEDYLILYADDKTVFAECQAGLHTAINCMFEKKTESLKNAQKRQNWKFCKLGLVGQYYCIYWKCWDMKIIL